MLRQAAPQPEPRKVLQHLCHSPRSRLLIEAAGSPEQGCLLRIPGQQAVVASRHRIPAPMHRIPVGPEQDCLKQILRHKERAVATLHRSPEHGCLQHTLRHQAVASRHHIPDQGCLPHILRHREVASRHRIPDQGCLPHILRHPPARAVASQHRNPAVEGHQPKKPHPAVPCPCPCPSSRRRLLGRSAQSTPADCFSGYRRASQIPIPGSHPSILRPSRLRSQSCPTDFRETSRWLGSPVQGRGSVLPRRLGNFRRCPAARSMARSTRPLWA